MDKSVFERMGLTKSEAKLLQALFIAQGEIVPTNILLCTLYSPKTVEDMKKVLHDVKQGTWVLSGTRTLRVFMSKIRKKLGIEIPPQYNEGYSLSPSDMKTLNEGLGNVEISEPPAPGQSISPFL